MEINDSGGHAVDQDEARVTKTSNGLDLNSENLTREELIVNLYHSKTDRIFVRPIQGAYNVQEELNRLRARPRLRKAALSPFTDVPQCFSRNYIEPKDGITQAFHMHLEEYAPGASSQKHGHVNEAAFYILDGDGFEIHDGVPYDWHAGDVVIVHNNCMHQYFNANSDKPARALVIKTKPMYIFLNTLFQKTVKDRPVDVTPESEGFEPREIKDDFNHPEGGYYSFRGGES